MKQQQANHVKNIPHANHLLAMTIVVGSEQWKAWGTIPVNQRWFEKSPIIITHGENLKIQNGSSLAYCPVWGSGYGRSSIDQMGLGCLKLLKFINTLISEVFGQDELWTYCDPSEHIRWRRASSTACSFMFCMTVRLYKMLLDCPELSLNRALHDCSAVWMGCVNCYITSSIKAPLTLSFGLAITRTLN